MTGRDLLRFPFAIALFAVAAFASLVLPGMTGMAGAQTPLTPQQPLANLGAALPLIAWDSKSHGVLLVIAPDKVTAPATKAASEEVSDDAAKPLFAPIDRYGLNAGLVARHFDRKLIHLPTMTVFAPTKMVTLNRDLKPANPFADMEMDDRMHHLEASLTPAQWKLLGSEAGLGIGDLSREQQPLFEELLPENDELQRVKVVESSPGKFEDEPVDDSQMPIGDDLRRSLRIRLDRSPEMFLVDEKDHELSVSDSPFHADAVGAEKLALVEQVESFARASSRFGRQLRFQTSNHLKPGDLDFKSPSLNVWVTISGAATVGDLIAATRKATGLAIYADGRLARLAVALRGDSASGVRASDLLEALGWALTATYRRIGPSLSDPKTIAYVLTYDHEGLAVRRSLIVDWGRRGVGERFTALSSLPERIAKAQPGQYLSFTKGNLLDPTPESEKTVEAFVRDPNDSSTEATTPVSELTGAQRAQFEAGLKVRAKQHEDDSSGRDEKPRTDRVGMDFHLTMTLILPGVGEIPTDYSWYDDTRPHPERPAVKSLQPDSQPLSGANVILSVAAPHNRDQAEELVQAAVARGLSQLWIRVPNGSLSPPATLTDCIAAGQAHHLPVGVVVCLTRTPVGSLSPLAQNLNLYGETGPQWSVHVDRLLTTSGALMHPQTFPFTPTDVAVPGNVGEESRMVKSVAAMASTPGLSSLALCEAAPQGYGGKDSGDYYKPEGATFGYTIENRIAFLKQEGYDPIDIEGMPIADWMIGSATGLPFFETDGSSDVIRGEGRVDMREIDGKWFDFRAAQSNAAIAKLGAALSGKTAGLPIYLSASGSDDTFSYRMHYRRWEKPEAMRLTEPKLADLLKPSSDPGNICPIVTYSHADYAWMQITTAQYIGTHSEAEMVCDRLHRQWEPDSRSPKASRPAATVLDLTTYSTQETLQLIRNIFLPVSRAGNP